MTYVRRSGGQIALLVLSLLGVGISIYLTTVHYQHVPLVCSDSGVIDCARVTTSRYSVVPGTTIPITVPGLLWFAVSGTLAVVAWRIWPERKAVRLAQMVWTALGLLTVLYLVYAEIVLLRAICAWCTGLHVIILAMLLIAVFQVQQPESEEDVEAEDEDDAVASTIVRSE